MRKKQNHENKLLELFRNPRDIKIVQSLIRKLPVLASSSIKSFANNIESF
jgi:hypothetical protein